MTEYGEREYFQDEALLFAEQTGIDKETCKAAMGWAEDWKEITDTVEVDQQNAFSLMTARDVAVEGLGEKIPRDANNEPTFRAQYAATELFLRKHGTEHGPLRTMLEGDGIRPIPNFARLDTVLDTLLAERAAKKFPYFLEAAQLPQEEQNMPKNLPRGGVEHANFLFATCYYMRGGIKSFAAFRGLSKLYDKNPNIFDPEKARYMQPAAIAEELKDVGLSFANTIVSRHWPENARKLHELYGGDPRKIFENTTDYEVLLSRIQNKAGGGFKGFQEKMTSMLTYFLMSDELIEYFDFPLPVDFHVLRVSAANGIITFENKPSDGDIYHPKTLAMLRAMYHDYSVTHGTSQLDVCDAIWSLSSALCGEQPGNRMIEPNKAEGRKGRSTEIYPLPINVNDPEQQRRYERTCALCPIEETCELNFPSKRYYIQGKMIPSRRIKFPSDPKLF